ncbi:hypothetical protein BDV95DRAFT_570892 [Massariosphaeria phaeospora]|uniref:FAD-binding FR-type domain-containing protein n=1 Tax=Massariosphaeria phaeospora TaxID=100035 RepID=A0A7C8ML09_9PLEO|nr:hypothetical protein BDV95DRAFT_570892 [Massariosphaeria phaeospora]
MKWGDGKSNEEAGEGEAWSSSSSTVEGNVTPPDGAKGKKVDDADETSPLISASERSRDMKRSRKNLGIRKPYYVLKSWLLYQPRPLPLVHKTLPSNAVSLLVLAFLALNAFYNLYRMPLSLPYIFVFADRCGIAFTANLPLLYLLAAKTQPIKFLTGHSYESLNIFHRRLGELLCLEALLHFLGMFSVWYNLLRPLGVSLARFLFNRVVGLGLGAFVAYEALYLSSLGSFRQRWYELFLASHIVLQIAGLALLWFHHPTSQPYVGVALAIFVVDRLVFRLWCKASAHPATLTVLDDDETVLVSANWAVVARASALAPKNMTHGWRPNDHVFLIVPALSRKHALQAHPFTIFSAAPPPPPDSQPASPQQQQHAWLTLLIRAQSPPGFTHTLLTHARTHPHTHIRLDGPYGASHALSLLSASCTAILVAGGSGIAVAYPLLYALLQPPTPRATDVETAPRPRPSPRTVKLLWITHAPAHRLWVPEAKMLELQEWGLQLFVPPPTALAGRMDVGGVVGRWVEEQEEKEQCGGNDERGTGTGTGVVVSGPEGLVRDVRNTCAGLVGRGLDVRVGVEKFGW